jgi:ATP-dependent DNA ligase
MNNNKITLYKKDSKGKIREWSIWTESGDLVQSSGLIDGKMVEHRKTCKIKNAGKSNETTAIQQAASEMASSILSKRDEGYFTTKEDAENESVLLPMLAKSYGDHSNKIDWVNDNVFVQPKLDGMRCLAVIKDGKATLMSRDGKIIENMGHIIKALAPINYDIVLDGELYAHGVSFQENMKLIKKYRKGESEKISYHIYDTVSDKEYIDRGMVINGIRWKYFNHCEVVETIKISSEKELIEYHSKFLSDGYEGTMIRYGSAPYKVNGRSANLLKYKDFKDIDAKIVDITPAEQRTEWGVPVLEYNGQTFRAGCKMTHEEREDLLANKDEYIGKLANIRFFEMTDGGIPRFPIMVGIHEDR